MTVLTTEHSVERSVVVYNLCPAKICVLNYTDKYLQIRNFGYIQFVLTHVFASRRVQLRASRFMALLLSCFS